MMTREEANKLLKPIVREWNDDYDGTYYHYACVDREIFQSVAWAFDDGRITKEQFDDLTYYILSDYCREICSSIIPKIDTSDKKLHFKVENMNANELRIAFEDGFSKLEDIEQLIKTDDDYVESKDSWYWAYKSNLIYMFLALRELCNKQLDIDEIKIW